MQVIRKLELNSVLTAIAALIIVLVLIIGFYEVHRAVRSFEITDELLISLFERSTFRSDYLRTDNERAKKQWMVKNESIGRLLKSASKIFLNPDDQKAVQGLIRDYQATAKLFTGIVNLRERPKADSRSAGLAQDMEDRMSAQLEMRLYDEVLLIGSLQESARSRMYRVLTTTGLCVAAAIMLLLLVVPINTWSINRYFIRQIRSLDTGVQAIGGGDLDHRIDVSGNDEFATLSRAVNEMAARLQKSYQDIETEIAMRRQAEEVLREREERLRLHAENSPLAIVEWDADFIVTRWAGEAERIFGWAAQETMGRLIMDLDMIYEEDIPVVERTMDLLTDGVSRKVVSSNRNYTKDGQVIHCEWYNSVLLDDEGKMKSVMSQVLDVTERKMAERALAESEKKYRDLFENMTEEVHFWQLVRDEAGNIKTWRLVDANPPTLKSWGCTRVEEIRGKTTDEIFGPGSSEHYLPVVRKIFTEGVPYMFEDYFPNLGKHFRFTSVPLGEYFITTGADITLIKKAQEALHRSEARWNAAIESFGEGVIIATEDEQIIYWNPEARKMHGFTRIDEGIEPLEKTPISFQLWTPDGSHLLELDEWPMRRIKRGEIIRNLELRIKRPDQDWEKVFSYSGSMVDTAAGERLIFLSCHDLTELRRAEKALRENEERLRNMFARHRAVMLLIEPQTGAIIDANEAACEFYGYTHDTLCRFNIEDLNQLPDEEVKAERQRAAAKSRNYFIFPHRLADGSIRWVEVYSSPFTAKGKPMLFSVIHDITERKRIEDNNRMLAAIVESSDDAIIGKSLDGTITSWNRGAEQIYGYTGKEIVGKPISILAPPDLEDEMQDILKGIECGTFIEHIETRRVKKDGTPIHVSLSISPILDSEGRITGVSTIARDITDRKRMEDSMFNLLAELERSNKDLEQFAYVASHDLQEPLRIVSSFTRLLAKGYRDKLDQDAKDYIAYAVSGANRMQRLINDLLFYSRITTRGSSPAPVDMNAALGEALANLQLSIQQTGALVTNDILPAVMADYSQLVQVFQNLIGNAVKFHGEDPPRIHVSAVNAGNEWTVSVKDNGIGMEPRYFDRIFVIFQRLHTTDQYQGTGIGLALCKRIIQRFGGNIWVESEPGAGSTFYFTLKGAA